MRSFMVIRLSFFITQYWTNIVCSLETSSMEVSSNLYSRVSATFLETISHGFLTNSVTHITKISCAQACEKDVCVLFKFSEGKCITYSKGMGGLSRIPIPGTAFYGHHTYIDEQNTECPEMFKKFERKCYFFNQNKRTWYNAQRDCARKDGRLVSVLDRLTQDFIFLNMQGEGHWIGSQFINEEWIWMHENTVIAEVTPGMLHISGDGTCLETYANIWNDLPCIDHRKSICVL